MSAHIALGALLALLPPVPARAAHPQIHKVRTISRTGYDEFRFLGWNDACSVAMDYFSYPPAGEGLQDEPTSWRIGTVTVPPDATEAKEDWIYDSRTITGWQAETASEVSNRLGRAGYTKKGFVEEVRDAAVAPKPGLERLLRTTSAFKFRGSPSWPPKRYLLYQIYYSPLGTCAFFLFRDKAAVRDSFRYKLFRLDEPGVRHLRAQGHVTNGLLLYEAQDIYAAVEELGIAAGMNPEYDVARYQYARLLATHGRYDETLVELKAAFGMDKKYKDWAREAIEFRDLRHDLRFKALLRH